jgi:hypothetical protein
MMMTTMKPALIRVYPTGPLLSSTGKLPTTEAMAASRSCSSRRRCASKSALTTKIDAGIA